MAGGGQLVESVVAPEDESRGAAVSEDAGDQRHTLQAGDAHRVCFGPRGVGQRPEEVEHGRHAEFLAYGTGVTESGVEGRREDERDAGPLQRVGDRGRIQGQLHAERSQHIRGSGGRARGAVAVLDDGDAGGSGHDGRHRRDVHGSEAVAAGTDDVEHLGTHRQRYRSLEDGVTESDDLVDRLPLRAERDQEGADLTRRRLPRHDASHRPCRFRHAEVAPVQQ